MTSQPVQAAGEPAVYEDGEIDKTIRRRVCSRCYGDLVKQPTPDRKWFLICPACNGRWGYTTIARRTAENRGQVALSEYYEAKDNLKHLFPAVKRTEAEILKDLGF